MQVENRGTSSGLSIFLPTLEGSSNRGEKCCTRDVNVGAYIIRREKSTDRFFSKQDNVRILPMQWKYQLLYNRKMGLINKLKR